MKLINPSWLNLLIPLSIVVHFIFPIKTLIQSPVRFLGMVFILLGLMLNLAASDHLRRNQTPVDFAQAPIRLVRDGPFRFSRNPIYLGGVTVLIGLAIVLGSLASLCFPVVLFLLLHGIYIPAEEKEMEGRFGSDYLEYKQAVRRWV